jgi:hypothetical protein
MLKINYNRPTQGLFEPDSCLESCQNNNNKSPKAYQRKSNIFTLPDATTYAVLLWNMLTPNFGDRRLIGWRSMSPGKYHWPRHCSPEPSHRVAEPHPSTLPNLDPCPTYPRENMDIGVLLGVLVQCHGRSHAVPMVFLCKCTIKGGTGTPTSAYDMPYRRRILGYWAFPGCLSIAIT